MSRSHAHRPGPTFTGAATDITASRQTLKSSEVASCIVVHALVYLSLRFSVGITRIIREAGIVLLTRISGLLLSAIAVQLVADSVRAFVRQG